MSQDSEWQESMDMYRWIAEFSSDIAERFFWALFFTELCLEWKRP